MKPARYGKVTFNVEFSTGQADFGKVWPPAQGHSVVHKFNPIQLCTKPNPLEVCAQNLIPLRFTAPRLGWPPQ